MPTKPATLLHTKIQGLSQPLQDKLLHVRELIYAVAHENPVIGELQETLKWGQPSYAPKKANVGTPIRIDVYPHKKDYYALYFHCQTSLISQYKSLFPHLRYEGNRAIVLSCDEPLPEKVIKQVILHALTYKLHKRDGQGKSADAEGSPLLTLDSLPPKK